MRHNGHMSESENWLTVDKSAERINKTRRQIYRYLEIDPSTSKIRRRHIGRTLYVHTPSLLDYEATVTPGRPRST